MKVKILELVKHPIKILLWMDSNNILIKMSDKTKIRIEYKLNFNNTLL